MKKLLNKWTIALFFFFFSASLMAQEHRSGLQHSTFRQLKQELWFQGVQIIPYEKLGEQAPPQESAEVREASLEHPEEIQHIMRKFYSHPLI